MQALTLSDLSMVNHEPRVLDLKLADALGFAQHRDIRKLIDRNRDELHSHGDICATVAQNTDPKGRGRPTQDYWLNEPQALLIAMFSRTDRAAQVRAEIIRVFMEWRRGQLAPALAEPQRPELPGEPLRVLELKLASVREARLLFGPQRAAKLWEDIGLPAVPQPTDTPDAKARECFNVILSAPLAPDDMTGIEDLIERAAEEDEMAALHLRNCGIRVQWEGNDLYVWVANRARWLEDLFDGTEFDRHRWRLALARLPGAKLNQVHRVAGNASRGVMVPGRFLDAALLH